MGSWEYHKNYAEELGYTLASIENVNAEVLSLLEHNDIQTAWLGGERIKPGSIFSDASAGGPDTWKWIDNSDWRYTDWIYRNTQQVEPAYRDGVEDYLVIHRIPSWDNTITGSWDDLHGIFPSTGEVQQVAAVYSKKEFNNQI